MRPAESFVLQAALILPGADHAAIADGALRIRNGLIEDFGPRSDVIPAHEEPVADLGALTLLPGLIDAHDHLSGHGRYSIGDHSVSEPDEMYALVAAQQATLALSRGVTTMRLVGAPGGIDFALRDAISAGLVNGPRLICAGRGLSMTGGHFWAVGAEVDGPVAAMKAARRNIADGADLIKIFASGGVGISRQNERPGHAALSIDEIAAAVLVAHHAGRKAAAHAHGDESIAHAMEAGVDCIEHGTFLTRSHADWMARENVALVPTLGVMRGIAAHAEEWGLPRRWAESADAVLDPHAKAFRSALDAGVLLAAGTDGTEDLVGELEIFESLGMSRSQAIRSATQDAATVIGGSAHLGVLASGHAADVIGVRGNPLEALSALRKVELVIVDGEIRVSRLDDTAPSNWRGFGPLPRDLPRSVPEPRDHPRGR